jgi:AcrR family transcriptional regulator
MARRKGASFDRGHVVAAAIACLEADGPDALSLSAVARRMGIKPPSLYNHVRNADDLAWALTIEGNRQLTDALEAAINDIFAPHDVLFALALATRTWAQQNPALYTVMTRTKPQNDHPEYRPVLVRALRLFQRPLGLLGVRGDEAIHTIRGLRAAMHGFVTLENVGQFQMGQDTEASYRWLIEATLRGLPGMTLPEGAERVRPGDAIPDR